MDLACLWYDLLRIYSNLVPWPFPLDSGFLCRMTFSMDEAMEISMTIDPRWITATPREQSLMIYGSLHPRSYMFPQFNSHPPPRIPLALTVLDHYYMPQYFYGPSPFERNYFLTFFCRFLFCRLRSLLLVVHLRDTANRTRRSVRAQEIFQHGVHQQISDPGQIYHRRVHQQRYLRPRV
jgi:hypothetical protein